MIDIFCHVQNIRSPRVNGSLVNRTNLPQIRDSLTKTSYKNISIVQGMTRQGKIETREVKLRNLCGFPKTEISYLRLLQVLNCINVTLIEFFTR